MVAEPASLRVVEPAGVLLDPEAAHAYLRSRGAWQFSKSKMYDFLAVDALPNVRVNGRYYLHPAELDDWIAHGRVNRFRALDRAAPATVQVTAEAITEGLRGLLAKQVGR